jgi:hypothetical protein
MPSLFRETMRGSGRPDRSKRLNSPEPVVTKRLCLRYPIRVRIRWLGGCGTDLMSRVTEIPVSAGGFVTNLPARLLAAPLSIVHWPHRLSRRPEQLSELLSSIDVLSMDIAANTQAGGSDDASTGRRAAKRHRITIACTCCRQRKSRVSARYVELALCSHVN